MRNPSFGPSPVRRAGSTIIFGENGTEQRWWLRRDPDNDHDIEAGEQAINRQNARTR